MYCEMAKLAGIVAIASCYTDERNPDETYLLSSFSSIATSRIRDSRKGFKMLTLNERRFKIETTSEQPKEKRKFLGLIPY